MLHTLNTSTTTVHSTYTNLNTIAICEVVSHTHTNVNAKNLHTITHKYKNQIHSNISRTRLVRKTFVDVNRADCNFAASKQTKTTRITIIYYYIMVVCNVQIMHRFIYSIWIEINTKRIEHILTRLNSILCKCQWWSGKKLATIVEYNASNDTTFSNASQNGISQMLQSIRLFSVPRTSDNSFARDRIRASHWTLRGSSSPLRIFKIKKLVLFIFHNFSRANFGHFICILPIGSTTRISG